MTVTLSSKGQVLIPKQVRAQLQLHPGIQLICQIDGYSIILTPEPRRQKRSRLILDPATSLRITQSPIGVKVSNEDVWAALA